jgi:hypothetical protein
MIAAAALAVTAWAGEPGEDATIVGRVLGRGSGAPLPCAITARATAEAAPLAETRTDADGAFELHFPSGVVLLTADCDDHLPLTTPEAVASNERVEVTLRPTPSGAGATVIVYGRERREEVSRTVISGDELRAMPGSFGDPIRALQNLPGVARSQGIEGTIVVRGSEGINTGTYFDEIPVPHLFHFFVGRSVVNPALLDDVEFYPGGMPSRFGDVTQAVVNVRTLDTLPKPGLHGRVSADILDFAVSGEMRLADHWTAQAGWRTSWIGTLIGLGARVGAGLRGLGSDTRPAYPTLQYDDWLARVAYEDEDDRVIFTAFAAHDAFVLHPPEADLDGDGDLEPPPLPPLPYNPNRLFDSGFLRVQARWDHTEPRWEQTTWVAAGPDRQQSLLQGVGQLADGIDFGELTGWTVVARRRDRFELPGGAFKSGVDVVVNPITAKDYGDADYQTATVPTTRDLRTSLGAWAELQHNFGDLFVAPGLRVAFQAFNQHAGPQLEPRLTLRHRLDDHLTMTGFVGRFSQIPPADRYADGLGDPSLGVITAWQASSGLEGRWSNGVEVDFTVYGSRTASMIVKDLRVEVEVPPVEPGDDTPNLRAQSTIVSAYHAVTGYAFGVEGLLRMRPRANWFGWLAVTLGRSVRIDASGVVRPGDYDLPASVVLVGAREFPRRWRISGRLRVGSGYPYTPISGVYETQWDHFSGLPGPENAARLPVFRQIDIRIDKTWLGRRARWTAYLDVLNALNTKNFWLATYDPSYRKLEPVIWIPILPTLGVEVNY